MTLNSAKYSVAQMCNYYSWYSAITHCKTKCNIIIMQDEQIGYALLTLEQITEKEQKRLTESTLQQSII